MGNGVAVRVDNKGRFLIPKKLRHDLQVEPGDTLFVRRKGKTLHCAKAEDHAPTGSENPFDLLAEHAIREFEAGRTRSLREFAKEHNFLDLPDS